MNFFVVFAIASFSMLLLYYDWTKFKINSMYVHPQGLLWFSNNQ